MALATFRPGPGGPRCRLPPDPPSSLLLEATKHSAASTVQAFLLRKLRAVYAAAGRRVDCAERPLRAQHRAALPGGGVCIPQMREQPGRPWEGGWAPEPHSPARPAPPAGPTSDRGPPERHIPAQCQGGPTARGPGWAPRAFTCSAADHHKPRRASTASVFVTTEISRNVRLRAKMVVGGGGPSGVLVGGRPFVWEQVTAEDPALPRSLASPPAAPRRPPGPPTPAPGQAAGGPAGAFSSATHSGQAQ